MFSQWLGEHDELFKFISSAPCEEQQQHQTFMPQNNKVLQFGDIVNPNSLFDVDHRVTDTSPKPKPSRRRKLSSLDNVEESPKDYIKKIIHRDVERQRRQEMAGLYHNLRSIIPSQHFEGKRSISDHIHATAKYIIHMNSKIDELNKKKEKLKNSLRLPNPDSSDSGLIIAEKPCPDACEQPVITVKTCRAGIMEITVNIGKNGDLSLSKILRTLISEGMSIKSCISTRVHERQLHVIQSEVMMNNEEKIIDPDVLYKKLMGTTRT